MTDLAPSLPPVKAIGDFLNRNFTGRNNIRECFLLEWGLSSLVKAEESDPRAPELARLRKQEARESLGEAASLLASEIGQGAKSTIENMANGKPIKSRISTDDPGEISYREETVEEHIRRIKSGHDAPTFSGKSKRVEAFIHVCRAFVLLEANETPQIVMDHVAKAHFSLSPDKRGREFDYGRVSGSMLNEVKNLQSKATIREIRAEEERVF